MLAELLSATASLICLHVDAIADARSVSPDPVRSRLAKLNDLDANLEAERVRRHLIGDNDGWVGWVDLGSVLLDVRRIRQELFDESTGTLITDTA